MNIFKDLFSFALVTSLGQTLASFNMLDLRSRGEFSFYTPGGLAIVTFYCWLVSRPFRAGLIGSCPNTDSVVDVMGCSGVLMTVGVVFLVSTVSIFVIVQMSERYSAAAFINNLIIAFMVAGGVWALLRYQMVNVSIYSLISDALDSQGATNWTDPLTAFLSGLISVLVLILYSFQRAGLTWGLVIRRHTRADQVVVLLYVSGVVVLTYAVFSY